MTTESAMLNEVNLFYQQDDEAREHAGDDEGEENSLTHNTSDSH